MQDIAPLAATLCAGFVLGALFFGGLWWGSGKGLASPHPALWFFVSMLVRMTIVMAGFYSAAQGDWRRFLVCLIGFIVARSAITLLTRPKAEAVHAA